MTPDAFLQLALTGGTIVCSSQCSVDEIDKAKERGHFYTSPQRGSAWGWGFVFLPADQQVRGEGEPGPASV